MKTCFSLLPALVLLAFAASVHDARSAVATNRVPGRVFTPAVLAQPAPSAEAPPADSLRTINGVVTNIATPGAELTAAQASTKQEIRLVPGGAIADFARHKVRFTANANAADALQLTTPGNEQLHFQALFLAYYDTATGKSVLLGQAQDCAGEVRPPNQVVYPGAFSDLKCELRYTYTRTPQESFEQDLILYERPPPPEELGLNAETTRLEVWTEWFGVVGPRQRLQTLRLRPADPATGQPEVLATDTALDFHSMKIIAGKAFSLGGENDAGGHVPVAKSFQRIEGRDFLIETIDYLAVKAKLDALPRAAAQVPARNVHQQRAALLRSVTGRGVARLDTKPMSMAQVNRRAPAALVLDFIIVACVPVPADAISWWRAEGYATDALSTNHGILQNEATFAAGKVGQAFSLDGASNVVITNTPGLNPTNALTIETWVYVTGGNGDNRDIIGKDGESSDRQYLLSVSDVNRFRAHIWTTNGMPVFFDGGTSVQLNTWYHIAMTYDGTWLNLYVNGVADGSQSTNSPIITTTQPLRIGGGSIEDDDPFYFPGLIDEPTLYRRALSATEIENIYRAGAAGKCAPECASPSTNAVGWWPADGNTHDYARTNLGVWKGTAAYKTAGQVGQAFSLSGANNVEIADAPELNPTNAITLEAWVYVTGNQNNHRDIISKDGESSNRQYLLTDSSANKFHPHVWTAAGLRHYDGNTTVLTGVWYHVAMTYDSSILSLYVNGTLDKSVTNSSSAIVTTTQPVRIGGGAPAGALQYYFMGSIDEPTIYKTALSASDISALYTAGVAGKCKVDSDQDGLSDLQEQFLGTNPNNRDTDGDGVEDGDEVFVYHTNPNNADTDGDGVIDQPFKVLITRPANNSTVP